jgi:hypothetical protein
MISLKSSTTHTYPKRTQKREETEENTKTINSQYSLVVTHPTTNQPAHGLSGG